MFQFSFFSNTSYSFDGKKDGEEVVLFLHRHWFTIVSKIIYIFIAAFIPFIIFIAAGSYILEYNLGSVFATLWAAYYLFLWYSLFYVLTMYALDTWIVTNLRILDSTQHGFFNRNISELNLGSIQDVSYNIEGAIPTMMNFGFIQVQTAGAQNHFIFQDIPNPQNVKDEIMKIVHDYKIQQSKQNEI